MATLPDPKWNYLDTFITVAPDSVVTESKVPEPREQPTIPQLEYELLSAAPGKYTQQEIQFAVHVRRLGLSPKEVKARRQELWDAFFSKPHACLRASALPKKYGWGIHFDPEGRITLVPIQSSEYRQFAKGTKAGPKVVAAMRSSRKS